MKVKRKFDSAEIRTRLIWVKVEHVISLATKGVTFGMVKLVNLSLLVS